MIILALGLVFATFTFPGVWRNDTDTARALSHPQAWWPYGPAHWLRFLRGGPVLIVAGWLMVLTTLVIGVSPELIGLGVARAIALAFGVLTLLFITAYVFGRPTFIIPPWLRDGRDESLSELS